MEKLKRRNCLQFPTFREFSEKEVHSIFGRLVGFADNEDPNNLSRLTDAENQFTE